MRGPPADAPISSSSARGVHARVLADVQRVQMEAEGLHLPQQRIEEQGGQRARRGSRRGCRACSRRSAAKRAASA